MGVRCQRAWQAEAVADGRLCGSDRESFARHARICAECATERSLLERLDSLACALPADAASELERRRLRQETLRRADALITGRAAGQNRERHWRLPVAAAAAAFAVAGGWWLPGGSDPASPIASTTKAIDSSASVAGQASTPIARSAERASNERQPPERAPTSARAESTAGEAATEAAIAAANPRSERPASASPAAAPFHAEVAAAAQATAQAQATASRAHPTATKANDGATAARHADEAPQRGGAEERSRDAEGDAGAEFARAVASFSLERYSLAEIELERFEKHFPEDARVEDAAFLRAICRERLGDRAGAARHAGEYLKRFPSGFRSREARAIRVRFE